MLEDHQARIQAAAYPYAGGLKHVMLAIHLRYVSRESQNSREQFRERLGATNELSRSLLLLLVTDASNRERSKATIFITHTAVLNCISVCASCLLAPVAMPGRCC